MLKVKKISRRKFLKIASASGMALGLGSLTGPYVIGQTTKKPIKIGVSWSLTGRYARGARYCVEGYQLWAKHINEMGYSYGNEHLPRKGPGLIDGRPVELVILDDASDPTTGARLAQHLIAGEKVDLLLGSYASSITMATKPIIEANGMPTVFCSASSHQIWGGQNLKWMVQIMAPTTKRFAGFENLVKEAGYKKIAIVYLDDAMPIAAVAPFRERLEKAGFEIVFLDAYPIGINDLVPVVRKARDAGAEVLTGGSITEDAILMAKAALSMNWAPKIFWHMAGFTYPDFPNALGQNVAWHCGDDEWLAEANWPGNKELVAAYRKEYNKEPEWLLPAGYGGCQILEEAVKRAGSIEDKKAIRDIMFKIERDTVYGHYKVNPLGHPDAGLQIGVTRVGVQYQLDKGKIVRTAIWPPQIATGKLIHPFRWEKL